jgi:hypothetical protein
MLGLAPKTGQWTSGHGILVYMKKKLCVLYIPGLGDNHVKGQRLAVKTWHIWGVETEFIQMNWANEEKWESKQDRLLDSIDRLTANNKIVGLVGASAGASAVINAYLLRKPKLVGCVLIAGKVNNADSIGENYRRINPAFIESAQDCVKALDHISKLDRKHILSRYAIIDLVVRRQDSYIDGANNQMVPTFGHAFTIVAQLIFGAPSFLRFLKNQAK